MLKGNKIEEIEGLGSLKELNTLGMSIPFLFLLINNNVYSTKPLLSLHLHLPAVLSNNQIKEIKGLNTLTKLKKVALSNNKITVIPSLEKNHELQVLHIHPNILFNTFEVWNSGKIKFTVLCLIGAETE